MTEQRRVSPWDTPEHVESSLVSGASVPQVARRRRSLDLSTIRLPKSAELLARDIRRRIARFEIKVGERLPVDSALGEYYGVSRQTLREAFRILEAESLLEVRPGRNGGAFVHQPSTSVAARGVAMLLALSHAVAGDVLETLVALEVSAIRDIASRASADEMQGLAVSGRNDDTEHPIDSWHREFRGFSLRLLELGGNGASLALTQLLWDILEPSARSVCNASMTVKKQRALLQTSLDAHAGLVDLLSARDARRAEQLWGRHRARLRNVELRFLDQRLLGDLF